MRLKSHLHLLFFIALSFSMARCGILKKEPVRPVQKERGTNEKQEQLRRNIAEFAKQQIGTKYKYAGKDPKGFDCSGFVFFVMNKYGIALPGSSRTQENYGKPVDISKVQTGDLIFFRRTKNGDVFHVGIVYKNGANGLEVVHSTSSRGVVVDNISNNSYWQPKFKTARNVVDK